MLHPGSDRTENSRQATYGLHRGYMGLEGAYLYIYIYICVCVCVCMDGWIDGWMVEGLRFRSSLEKRTSIRQRQGHALAGILLLGRGVAARNAFYSQRRACYRGMSPSGELHQQDPCPHAKQNYCKSSGYYCYYYHHCKYCNYHCCSYSY